MNGSSLKIHREYNPQAKYLLLRDFPKDLLAKLKEDKSYIAGGSISALFDMRKFDEYDIFSISEDCAEKIDKYIMANIGFFKQGAITHRANTYSYITDHGYAKKVQVIFIPIKMGPPEHIIRTFDFRACMGAYDPCTDQFVYAEGFKEDNHDRKLVYNVESSYPLNSILRIAKYTARGYKISRADILNIALRVNKLDIYDSRDLVKEVCAEGYDTLDDYEFDTKYVYSVIEKHVPKPKCKTSYFVDRNSLYENDDIPF